MGTWSNNIWIKWIIHRSNFHNNTKHKQEIKLAASDSTYHTIIGTRKYICFNMAFLILGWEGNAKGLASNVNYLSFEKVADVKLSKFSVVCSVWCRCQIKLSVYVSIVRHVFAHIIYLFGLFRYWYLGWLSAHCLQPVYTSLVGKPAVIQLCRVSALSDHLFPTLSHRRLAVLITACFSLFSPSGLS